MVIDNLKTWPENVYFLLNTGEELIKDKLLDVRGYPSDVRYIRADVMAEREKKLIMACFDYCNTPIAIDRQIYADAGLEDLK